MASTIKIFYNAEIHSMDNDNHIFEAMAIRGDRIIALGKNKDIFALKEEVAEAFDLKGRVMVPGLIDTHTHLIQAGLSELKGEIFIPRTIHELLEYVRRKTTELPEGKWIYFRNTYPTRLMDYRYPMLKELDIVSPNHPVFIDGAYAGQVNSFALKLAGIYEDTPDPKVGKFIRDNKTGKLTGLLFLCNDIIKCCLQLPAFSYLDCKRGVINLQKEYNGLGITSVVEGKSDEIGIQAINELYHEGRLSLRVSFTKVISPKDSAVAMINKFKQKVSTPKKWGKLAFCKVNIDGGILTGTAYMRQPYKDNADVFGINSPDYRGIVHYNKDQLVEMIEVANHLDLQMTAHCIGDAAIDLLLDAYETCQKRQEIRHKRHTMIHCDFTDQATLKRIKALNLNLLFQPVWLYKDGSILEKVLREETMKSFLPYRSYLEHKIKVAAGSDHMVKYDSFSSQNPYNPFIGMYNMITRRSEDDKIIGHEQTISREDALRMYTINGAYITFEEEIKGSLEVGKLADFAVLSRNYFKCPEEEIMKIRSVLTVVGGRVVYQDDI